MAITMARFIANALDEFQFGLKVSDLNLATPVHPTERWQFSAFEVFRVLCIRRGCKLRPRLNPVRGTVLTRVCFCRRGGLTVRVIPASEVFNDCRVCHLVFFVEVY